MKKKKLITIKNAKLVKPKKPLGKYSKVGVSVEKEHTPNTKIARIIAANHKDEAGDAYYKSLSKMERKLKKRGKK
jgi:hypothetical protein